MTSTTLFRAPRNPRAELSVESPDVRYISFEFSSRGPEMLENNPLVASGRSDAAQWSFHSSETSALSDAGQGVVQIDLHTRRMHFRSEIVDALDGLRGVSSEVFYHGDSGELTSWIRHERTGFEQCIKFRVPQRSGRRKNPFRHGLRASPESNWYSMPVGSRSSKWRVTYLLSASNGAAMLKALSMTDPTRQGSTTTSTIQGWSTAVIPDEYFQVEGSKNCQYFQSTPESVGNIESWPVLQVFFPDF
eukprot:CAMPEP_0195007406 /NCGR_PEP_ID=MMETSP0326_2-20130528/7601_1 /TAXON_ID=2866 ORGANISM="Crypthecodinium cohnii, Strain Seligo" /NCGR_SAMPLE_ID=MMETSP0326_2 /ASSEMBLY_ACC=CAM_ASM_000348 /LENGTH=246 /DNA_ID=CAMNT_0040014751 /DNA_START=40 /DNA_END=780 /DNA_ORIENTATION=+